MRRPPGMVLGALTGALLVVQAVLIVPGSAWIDRHDECASLGYFLDFFLPILCAASGRVALAFLPPGELGGHDARSLPATMATSAALGSLALLPLEGLLPGGYYPVYGLVLLLALGRWLTLPGAMVPRHRTPPEPFGWDDRLVAIGCSAGVGLLLLSEDGVNGFLACAIALLVFHGLGVARRRRSGRYAVLVLVALSLLPVRPSVSLAGMLPAVSLTLGAAFLIGWLRRADRRAGALSGIGFGSLFLGGVDPLALVAGVVFVLASNPRQRTHALAWAGGSGALSFAVACLHEGPVFAPRGRLALADEVLHQLATFGVAWPALLGALVLGALCFEWRGPTWKPGAIEVPKREALALGALLAASAAALALPWSPRFEAEALVALFPLCALLAGLLLIPPEDLPLPRES